MNDARIRALRPEDWPAVEAIYREGIATGNATFEAEPPSWASAASATANVSRA